MTNVWAINEVAMRGHMERESVLHWREHMQALAFNMRPYQRFMPVVSHVQAFFRMRAWGAHWAVTIETERHCVRAPG